MSEPDCGRERWRRLANSDWTTGPKGGAFGLCDSAEYVACMALYWDTE
jgi:hypothetical protein